jgi:hypothetical protein
VGAKAAKHMGGRNVIEYVLVGCDIEASRSGNEVEAVTSGEQGKQM